MPADPKGLNITNHAGAESFLELFKNGDVDAARTLLQRRPELGRHSGYQAHPLLREFVDRNGGHCHRRPHPVIADMLISDEVRSFRDAVLEDRVDDVRGQLGADPNLVDARSAGRTPLHLLAARGVGREAIQRLVRAGADVNVRDDEGNTPLDLARSAKRQTAIRQLIALGAGESKTRVRNEA